MLALTFISVAVILAASIFLALGMNTEFRWLILLSVVFAGAALLAHFAGANDDQKNPVPAAVHRDGGSQDSCPGC